MRRSLDWTVITVGEPTPEALDAFIAGWARLIVRIARRWQAEGRAVAVEQPDGSWILESRDGTQAAVEYEGAAPPSAGPYRPGGVG